jgi:hypothetical protein
MGERKGLYRILVGKTEERRPLRRPDVDVRAWTGLSWLRIWRTLVNAVINFGFHKMWGISSMRTG